MAAIIVAIAGTSGSGKTTQVKALAERFQNTSALYMDDYEVLFNQEPFEFDANYKEFEDWLSRFDFNKIHIPNMIEDLESVKKMEQGTYELRTKYAREKRVVPKSAIIFVEFPFGREIGSFADVIDLVININLPMEISLIRHFKRSIIPALDERVHQRIKENVKEFTSFLASEINNYEKHWWKNYIAVNRMVEKNNDYLVNGLLTPDEITTSIIEFLHSNDLTRNLLHQNN